MSRSTAARESSGNVAAAGRAGVKHFLHDRPLLLLFGVAALGYFLGRIRLLGFSLGVAAVLFAGLLTSFLSSASYCSFTPWGSRAVPASSRPCGRAACVTMGWLSAC